MKKLPIFKMSSKKRLDILLEDQTLGLVWAACSATSDLYSKTFYPQAVKEKTSQVSKAACRSQSPLGKNLLGVKWRLAEAKLVKFPKNLINAYCPSIDLKLVGCAVEILVPGGVRKYSPDHPSDKKPIEMRPPKRAILEKVQSIAGFLGEISEHNPGGKDRKWDTRQFQGAFVRSFDNKLLFISKAEIYQSYLIQNALKSSPEHTLGRTYQGVLGRSKEITKRPGVLLEKPLSLLFSQLKSSRKSLCYLTHSLLKMKTEMS